MEGILNDFTERMKKIFGDDLVSVILYGSAADPDETHPKDINLMVVARNVEPKHLTEYRNIAPKYIKKGIRNPLLLAEEFLKNSADVFPMEYIDILKRRRVLHGADPFDTIEVDPKNLRHQIEFELKGKLLLLKKIFLSTFNDRNLTIPLNESISSILALVRGLLILMGESPTGDPKKDLAAIEEKTGKKFDAIKEVRELRKKDLKTKEPVKLYLRYLEEVKALCTVADELEEKK